MQTKLIISIGDCHVMMCNNGTCDKGIMNVGCGVCVNADSSCCNVVK